MTSKNCGRWKLRNGFTAVVEEEFPENDGSYTLHGYITAADISNKVHNIPISWNADTLNHAFGWSDFDLVHKEPELDVYAIGENK